jgi:hypothetical protein
MRNACLVLLFSLAVGCNFEEEEDPSRITQLQCNCDIYPAPCCCNTPVVLDLAGDGVEFTSPRDGVSFELASGKIGPWSWTEAGSDDAWLVRDMTENGVVDNGFEMFSDSMPQPRPLAGGERNGFAALAQFDHNRDGSVNADDPVWEELKLWQDRNQDGISQPEELQHPADFGIEGLSVRYAKIREPDGKGNVLRYSAAVQSKPGSTVGMTAYDVILASATPSERAAMGLPDTLPPRVVEERAIKPAVEAAARLFACVFSLRAPSPERIDPDELPGDPDFPPEASARGGWDGGVSCLSSARIRTTLYQKKDGSWYNMGSGELNVAKNTDHTMTGRICSTSVSQQWKSVVRMVDNGAEKTSSTVSLACDAFATPPPGCN